jgi:omega-amidase
MISIALVQPDLHWENAEMNLQSLSGILRNLDKSTDVILLPELFSTGFSMRSRELGEPMEGRSIQWMASMSRELKSSVAGSLIIREDGDCYNRLIWMHEDGSYQYYDKRHLFRMGGEHEHYSRGTRRLIVRDGEFRFLPLVCYDLRFPVWSRNRDDYDVLVYLSNWPAQRHDVWASLLKARAIENQAFVIGVNRVGTDGMGISYRGCSMAFNARGQRIASLYDSRPCTRVIHLNIGGLRAFREKFPVWKDADPFELGNQQELP